MSGTFLGMPPFPAAAQSALADSQLRANLAHATSTIRAKRAAVVAEVADWEELRTRAAQIKDDTLAHLDVHLAGLEDALSRRGARVHRAATAQEACAIVAGITKAHGADEVVKIKSMATAEIGLNEALAAQGISAWETDLAELIVQLGEDLPSHILVPAIHRNRAEIREIFLRRMGEAGRPAPAGLTDQPAVLAAAAREHLREKFLRAKVAVSGANFAVAETGTLVVVESEGNGRMCLTLPEVLISVVGVEKVVPTFRDLDVFLQLLPRSSTGERMNPYTSLWSGVTPGDGPQEVHVVLVDNGRTRALADPVGRQALRCIRCSACLNVCPVYERVGGHAYGSVYPGPIGAILNPLLKGVGSDPQTDSLPYASSLCGACFEVCPVKIDIPSVLVDLRTQVVDSHRAGRATPEAVAMKAAGWAFGSARRLAVAERLSGLGGALGNRMAFRRNASGRAVLARLPFAGAWAGARDLPLPPAESFRQWWSREHAGRSEPGPGTPLAAPDRGAQRGATGGAEQITPADGALAGERRPAGDRAGDQAGDQLRHTGGAGVTDLFVERVEDYRATVTRTTAADLVATIRALLDGAACVVPPDLGVDLPGARADDADDVATLDATPAVVTRCALAIAETGTIVLDHTAGQGRRVITLLPDRHLCIVAVTQIVSDVPHAVAALDPRRPQTWISGPSATSDIELDRVEGVHGPRILQVVLVTDA